jgi:hypothetical protein
MKPILIGVPVAWPPLEEGELPAALVAVVPPEVVAELLGDELLEHPVTRSAPAPTIANPV